MDNEELFASLAMDDNALPIAMIAHQGPPPAAEFYLSLMRSMIEETGQATGCICFGTETVSGMFPLVHCNPQEGLGLLILMRQQGLVDSIAWVALAADSWRKVFPSDVDPEDINKGDLERMHEAGDPEVEEVLIVTCKAPDGPGYDASQGYSRTPDGIEWAEVEYLSPGVDVQGEINRLMTELVLA